MKITLKRKLEIKSAVVYLKLGTDVLHEEIKKYLGSNMPFQNEIVERRVRKYLAEKGFFDSQNQLTGSGQKAKESGIIKETEEGKYQIWFIEDDLLFGNRIFYFKRIKPEAKELAMNNRELNFSGETFFSLPIYGKDSKNPVEFSVLEAAKQYEEKDSININCTWTWNGIQSSVFAFEGRFSSDVIDNKKPVDFKIDLKPHIAKIIPNWNNDTNRCKLKLENIIDDDTYCYFEYSGPRDREGYDSCMYEKLPVEPYNLEEAINWRDRIVNIGLKEEYIRPDDFTENLKAVNHKEGFSAYLNELDVPDLYQYIEKLEPAKKSDRDPAYWHLAAPLDLNVEIPQSLRIKGNELKNFVMRG